LIGEPFTYHTTKELVGPFSIINAPGNTLTITEIKFSQITVKMRFLTMLIHALHTTFEGREKALCGVCMYGRISKGIFMGD
jgi:hypothetical protein